jgi:YgiT-type zinc finger domain-containing protein
MKFDPCEYCDGKVKPDIARVDHWWKGSLTVIENVPVGICSQCGERYYEAAVLRQMDRIAQGKVGSVRRITIPVSDYRRIKAA